MSLLCRNLKTVRETRELLFNKILLELEVGTVNTKDEFIEMIKKLDQQDEEHYKKVIKDLLVEECLNPMQREGC